MADCPLDDKANKPPVKLQPTVKGNKKAIKGNKRQ
jgi:hypothetical protein